MKKIITTFIFLTLVVTCFAANGFLDVLKNAAENKDRQLIIFYKPDCPYCLSMDKQVSKDLSFQEKLVENFNIQIFDITSSEGRIMADRFNVHAVPSMENFNVADGNFTLIKGFAGTQKLLVLLGLAEPERKIIEKIAISLPNEKVNQNTFGVCANGIVEAGEGCDDGNLTNGDGCNSVCSIETGFNCAGSPSICSTTCGDGIVASGEGCDDGNLTNGDGCNSVCNIEAGFNCAGSPSICSSVCGDGIVASSEVCDDGNLTNGDGCNSVCNIESGFYCSGSPSVCSNAPPANDNCSGAILLPGTNGTANGQNETATNSVSAPVPTCQSNITKDVWYRFTLATTKNVQLEVNGPSVTDPVLVVYTGSCPALTEVACDDDGGPGTYSLIRVTLNAGTYFVRVGTYDITATGTFSLVYNLNLSSICGNNIIEAGEECDDGNLVNGDNCSSVCTIENVSTSKGVSVNEDATRAHPSAMLDVKSFDRGVLIPRMNSSQRTAIVSPAKGLVVFDNTTNTFWFYNGGGWIELVGGSGGGTGSGLPAGTANQTLRNNGTTWLSNSALQNDGTNTTVTGQLKINGGTPGAGKVLTSDATGLGSWVLPANSTGFSIIKTDGNLSIPSSLAYTKVSFNNQQYNNGNAYSIVNSDFTAPATGFYHFDVKLKFSVYGGTPGGNFVIALYRRTIADPTGLPFYEQEVAPSTVKSFSENISTSLSLNAGDIIDVRVSQNGTVAATILGPNSSGFITNFSGFRIN